LKAHEKCLGRGFTEEEKKFLVENACGKLDLTSDQEPRCTAYAKPELWWRPGFYCPLATHYKPKQATEKKHRVGQQKQKKSK
jgi:hypothetical protein